MKAASVIALGNRIFDAIVPRSCPVCGRVMTADIPLCPGCLVLMPGIGAAAGQRLRKLLDISAYAPGIARALFTYRSGSEYSALVKDAKYHSRPTLSFDLGVILAKTLLNNPSDASQLRAVDVLLPAPMHWRSRMDRGYNQARHLALGIASVTGAAVGDNLVAIGSHNAQARSSRDERLQNLRHTMTLEHADELAGLNIAIVDDVVTTGATVSECIITLSKAQVRAASLGLIALAVTPS